MWQCSYDMATSKSARTVCQSRVGTDREIICRSWKQRVMYQDSADLRAYHETPTFHLRQLIRSLGMRSHAQRMSALEERLRILLLHVCQGRKISEYSPAPISKRAPCALCIEVVRSETEGSLCPASSSRRAEDRDELRIEMIHDYLSVVSFARTRVPAQARFRRCSGSLRLAFLARPHVLVQIGFPRCPGSSGVHKEIWAL